MSLLESLYPECIQIGSKAVDKDGVLWEIAGLAKNNPALAAYSEGELYDALEEREKIGSTGFGEGVAIPHCSLDRLSEFVVGVLIIPGGVEFKSLDGKKTAVFFFIIGPRRERNRHIQLLSSISKLLQQKP